MRNFSSKEQVITCIYGSLTLQTLLLFPSAVILSTPSTLPDVATRCPSSSHLSSATPVPSLSALGLRSLQTPATPYTTPTPLAKAVSIIAANLSSNFSGLWEYIAGK